MLLPTTYLSLIWIWSRKDFAPLLKNFEHCGTKWYQWLGRYWLGLDVVVCMSLIWKLHHVREEMEDSSERVL